MLFAANIGQVKGLQYDYSDVVNAVVLIKQVDCLFGYLKEVDLLSIVKCEHRVDRCQHLAQI